MSSRPVDLFRQSWGRLSLLMLMLMSGVAVIGLTQIGVQTITESGSATITHTFNWGSWVSNQLASWLLALIVVSILPWLTLTFAGEWFYTRPLPRRELFQTVWREYLRWWGGASALLLGLLALQPVIDQNSGTSFTLELGAFISSLSLMASLMMAAPAGHLRRLAAPLGLLMVWMLVGDRLIGPGEIHFGHGITWLAWLSLLAWTYVCAARQEQDTGLSGADAFEDESHFLSRLGGLSLPAGPVVLTRPNRVRAWYSRWRLLTEYPRAVYFQLFMLIGGTIVGTMLLLGEPIFDFSGRSHSLAEVGLLGMVLLAMVTVLGLNPRYLLSRRWEFLATRPVSPTGAYLGNWLMQGLDLAILFVCGLGASSLLFPELGLNMLSLAGLMGFLWLGGELLLGLSVLFLGLSATVSPALLIAFFTLLHVHAWPVLALWALAAGVRIWDIKRFTQHWEPARSPLLALRRQLGHYAVPAGLLLIVVWTGMLSVPLTRQMIASEDAAYTPNQRLHLGLEVLSLNYTDRSIWERYSDSYDYSWREVEYGRKGKETLRQLMLNPHDPDAALAMARYLVDEGSGFSWSSNLPDDYMSLNYVNDRLQSGFARAAFWLEVGAKGNQVEKLSLEALRAQSQRNYPLAQTLLKQALSLKADPLLELQLAELQWNTFDYRGAMATYTQLIAQKSDQSGRVSEELADRFASLGDDNLALQYWLMTLKTTEGQVRDSAILHLLRYPFYLSGNCAELNEVIPYVQRFKSLTLRLKSQQAACLDQPEQIQTPLFKGIWYLKNGQTKLAVAELSKPWTPKSEHSQEVQKIWLAEALLADGQDQKALALVEPMALEPQSRWQMIDSRNLRNDLQMQAQRLLIQLKPSLSAATQVLMNSPVTDQDWPVIARAFANQPEQLNILSQLRADLKAVYAPLDAANEGLSIKRSSARLWWLLNQPGSPSDRPELQAASTRLKREFGR